MFKVNDIVRYNEFLWKVVSMDSQVKTVSLVSEAGVMETVEVEVPVLVSRPTQNWLVGISPRASLKVGPIVGVTKVTSKRPLPLRLYKDWLPSDSNRAGGSVFINPDIAGVNDMLVVQYQDGSARRLSLKSQVPKLKVKKPLNFLDFLK